MDIPKPMGKGEAPKTNMPIGPNINEIITEVKEISRRLRVSEERYINLRTKTQVTDQNMLSHNKKLFTEIRLINDDIRELKKEINEIKNNFLLVIKEMKSFSKKEDVKVLQRYIEMWEPIRFVTREEVEKIIDEKMENK